MSNILLMEEYGLVANGRSFLDFGSSNLYGATKEQIEGIVRRHNPNPRDDLSDWAAKLADGSGKGESGNALNNSFIGELLEELGMTYDAVDIADGYKTTIVDLNSSRLPEHMRGAYDTVVNFGTSEHILNQMGTFAAIHEAAKPEGFIMNMVPSIGYVDHCYFTYTSRFFFDLAGFNNYEVVDMWYEGPAGSENVFTPARQYKTYFPALHKRLAAIETESREMAQDATAIPVFAIALIYRKQGNPPFMGTVETSTSVGKLPDEVMGSYHKDSAEEEALERTPQARALASLGLAVDMYHNLRRAGPDYAAQYENMPAEATEDTAAAANWVAGLNRLLDERLPGIARRASVSTWLDSNILGHGWGPADATGGQPFRWLAADNHATVYLRAPEDGACMIKTYLQTLPSDKLDDLTLRVNGETEMEQGVVWENDRYFKWCHVPANIAERNDGVMKVEFGYDFSEETGLSEAPQASFQVDAEQAAEPELDTALSRIVLLQGQRLSEQAAALRLDLG